MRIFFAFFATTVLFRNPFSRLPSVLPEGYGLNPQLQTPWMISHPPIVFTAYTFLILTFALILGKISGEQVNTRLLKITSIASWALFTIGIATGGLWAYQVLGWGGYWSWDPVETASLLPWLGLTMYLHLSGRGSNNGLLGEVAVLAAFDGVIFLSALTRGGILNSVHAYAFSPAGPVLLIFALGYTLYFALLAKGKRILPSQKIEDIISISNRLGVVALAGMYFVCLLGVSYPISH